MQSPPRANALDPSAAFSFEIVLRRSAVVAQ
jgi:hypothetical protein